MRTEGREAHRLIKHESMMQLFFTYTGGVSILPVIIYRKNEYPSVFNYNCALE
jgi:hypothetical protein